MTEGTPGTPDSSAAGQVPTPPAAGDLEFDEAWSEPHEGHDVTPEPPSREVPSFEDPNDR